MIEATDLTEWIHQVRESVTKFFPFVAHRVKETCLKDRGNFFFFFSLLVCDPFITTWSSLPWRATSIGWSEV